MQFQKISILPPQEGLEFPGWCGFFYETKKIQTCMKLNWNFQKGGEVLEKLLSVGEVRIFSGTTHFCRHKERGEWQFLTGLFTFAQNHFIFGTQTCFHTPSNAVYLFSFFSMQLLFLNAKFPKCKLHLLLRFNLQQQKPSAKCAVF